MREMCCMPGGFCIGDNISNIFLSSVFIKIIKYSHPGYMGASLTQLSRIMTQETTHHHTVNIYS